MASTTIRHAQTPSSTESIRAACSGFLARLLEAVAREIRIRRDMRLLASLDDAALHDIGLARSGVEDAVRHGRPDHPGLPAFKPAPSDGAGPALAPFADSEWR